MSIETVLLALIVPVLGYVAVTVSDIKARLAAGDVFMQELKRRVESLEAAKAVALLVLLFTLSGCGSTSSNWRHPWIATTNAVPEYVTKPAVTNIVHVDATNVVVTVTPESTVTNWTTNIVYSVNTGYTRTIETAQALNSNLNPTPSAPIINWALGGLSGVLSLVAGWMTKRASVAQRSAANTSGMLHSVIAGVEMISDPNAQQIAKDTIRQASVVFGHGDALHAVVQERTDG